MHIHSIIQHFHCLFVNCIYFFLEVLSQLFCLLFFCYYRAYPCIITDQKNVKHMYGIDVIKNDVPTSKHNLFIIKNAFTTIFNCKKGMKFDSCTKIESTFMMIL